MNSPRGPSNNCLRKPAPTIEYPIAIDNDYKIWRAFNNQYWPALYFIDARGPLPPD